MSGDGFSLSNYNTVAERIARFRTDHPEGSLQQVSLEFRELNGETWVIYTAAAYRSPDDPRPGMGTAGEPIPGRTRFTKDSEVQNAETAAWGRAIVAVLAADTQKGVASRDEVQARQPDAPQDPAEAERLKAWAEVANLVRSIGWTPEQVAESFAGWSKGLHISSADAATLRAYHADMASIVAEGKEHKKEVAAIMGETLKGQPRKDNPESAKRAERLDKAPEDEFVDPVGADA